MKHKPKEGFDFGGSVSSPCQREVSLSLVHALLSLRILYMLPVLKRPLLVSPSEGILF